MEPYRRDDEPLRDPEKGHVIDPDGKNDRPGHDRAEYDDKPDLDERPDHGLARTSLGERPDQDPDEASLGDRPGGSAAGEYAARDGDLPTRNDGAGTTTGPAGVSGDAGDAFASDRDRASGSPDLGEPVAAGHGSDFSQRDEAGDQSDLIVYPEAADHPTRSGDHDSLTAGVPDVEPEPVLATTDHFNDAPRSEPATAEGSGAGTAAEPIDFQQRWREVQAGFVDDPRESVERADQLVDEAVAAITSRRQGLVDRWKNSDQGDTENLRLALRDYRSLLEDLVGLSYSSAGQGHVPARNEAR